ncbi:acyl-CoA thioesterase [Winogradskyella sp. PE311]|uniref:acyl-CoA thioesterase n=1 Tax=Winogradskyella sp. PE311 TaxID=3366943 RepID=UPI00398097CF
MALPKILESQTKIRFQDCDPFNHLNNGKYTDYFMNHRGDQLLSQYELDIYTLAQTEGLSWVASANQIAYLKPALLMETVNIESQLIFYDTSKLRVEMRMYNENKSQLKAIIWTSFVYFNLQTKKRENHPIDKMNLFKQIINPIDATIFEDRVLQFRCKKY